MCSTLHENVVHILCLAPLHNNKSSNITNIRRHFAQQLLILTEAAPKPSNSDEVDADRPDLLHTSQCRRNTA